MNEQQRASASPIGGLLGQLEFLEAPYIFREPAAGESMTLKVRRYEIGLAERPIPDPPGLAVLPAVRLHLEDGDVGGAVPYIDFTNRGLIIQVADAMTALMRKLREAGAGFDARLALAVLPEGSDHVTMRLTREGERLDTRYKLELLEEG